MVRGVAIGRGVRRLGRIRLLTVEYSTRYALVALSQLEGYGVQAARLAAAVFGDEGRRSIGFDLLPWRRIGFVTARGPTRRRVADPTPFWRRPLLCVGYLARGAGTVATSAIARVRVWGFDAVLWLLLRRAAAFIFGVAVNSISRVRRW